MSLSSVIGKPSGYLRQCQRCGASETNGKVGTWLKWYTAHLDCERKQEAPAATTSAAAKIGGERVSRLFVSAYELGLICDTYSADTIAASKPIKKYEYEGELYTCVSHRRGYDAECYKLTPLDQWEAQENEEALPYPNTKRAGANFYPGMKVKVGKRDFVMTGPMTIFAVEEMED